VIKGVAFKIKAEMPTDTIFVAATSESGKPILTVMISDNLIKEGYNASQVVREAAKLIKGGGGGQPNFAQAGGKDIEGIDSAFEKMFELLKLK
ncbi:MAG: DHHA1 domain-containing protein, partial [Muribaculaceae bacterium]